MTNDHAASIKAKLLLVAKKQNANFNKNICKYTAYVKAHYFPLFSKRCRKIANNALLNHA